MEPLGIGLGFIGSQCKVKFFSDVWGFLLPGSEAQSAESSEALAVAFSG